MSLAPDTNGPLAVNPELVQPYYEVCSRFANFIESSSRAIKKTSKPGDFVFFSNRIVLHARNAFELNGGTRHLQSMFIDALEFCRRLAKLSIKLGNPLPVISFGDQDQQNIQFC